MEWTHLDKNGRAVMVDVTEKPVTRRMAVAGGEIAMSAACFRALRDGQTPNGDVLAAGRIAGIMAAKRTWELIPLCHPLTLGKIGVDFTLAEESCRVEVKCTVSCEGKTGVEMEALTGAAVALLTIYDMCKALDKSMVISQVRLLEKLGGKSGHYVAGRDAAP